MKLHKQLITLVGLGMLLVITFAVFSLQNMAAVFSQASRGVERISLDVQRIWKIEKEIDNMSMSVHGFIASGERRYRNAYETSRAVARRMLGEMGGLPLSAEEQRLASSILSDFGELERKADRIFSLAAANGGDRALTRNLIMELDGLLEWMGRDIEKYKQGSALRMGGLVQDLNRLKLRVNFLFFAILVSAMAFLIGFGAYLYRRVSVPLGELWEGTEAISRGDLDHKIRSHGGSDIARLAERFNDMAHRLKMSYADLEHKLLDRTRELAALNSVMLTLGQAGTVENMLNKALQKITESLSGMEPKGGIFLCDQSGERLNLVAHKGLPMDFVLREKTIAMGECLCGMVAQSGDIIFTEQGCKDPRHTRSGGDSGHAHIIIPIKTRGIVLGVIFLYTMKDFSLRSSDIQMLDTIGAQVGMAVENLRFYSEVKESSEKYWDLFENSREILCTIDLNGRLTAVNKSAADFLGYGKEYIIGRHVTDFLTEKGAEIAKKAIAGERPGSRQFMEFEAVRKDGNIAFLEISARYIYKNREPMGFQVSARDVTEQKKLHDMLVKAERLAAIGQVGIAVRHEINNPLTSVIGNAELLLEHGNDMSADLKTRLKTILSNALRISEIVKRLEDIREEKTVEYIKGVKMTDLKRAKGEG